MTTIAYKDGMLAADTQITWGDGSKLRVRKIITLPDGSLFAACGEGPYPNRMRKWAEGGFAKTRMRLPKGTVEAIHIHTDGTVWVIETDLEPEKLENSFVAIGTGSGYAMGAMAMGADARKAVEIASIYDNHTSEPIDAVRIGESTK